MVRVKRPAVDVITTPAFAAGVTPTMDGWYIASTNTEMPAIVMAWFDTAERQWWQVLGWKARDNRRLDGKSHEFCVGCALAGMPITGLDLSPLLKRVQITSWKGLLENPRAVSSKEGARFFEPPAP